MEVLDILSTVYSMNLIEMFSSFVLSLSTFSISCEFEIGMHPMFLFSQENSTYNGFSIPYYYYKVFHNFLMSRVWLVDTIEHISHFNERGPKNMNV